LIFPGTDRAFEKAQAKPALLPQVISMVELSPKQKQVIERLFEAGFRPIAIPPYESALCMRKGDCAAVLAPVPNGGIKLLAPPSYLLEGNFSVKLKRGSGEVFVWKKKEVEATPEKLSELESFRQELTVLLDLPPKQ
jgi:hypothetical protein